MSWRIVVISQRAKLDYQLGYMVVRGESVNKVFLNEMSILIVEHTSVSFTAALMAELVKNKIKVIFCDEKRNPLAELLPYYGAFDTSSKIRQQISWDDEIKGVVWSEIVRNKIKNQADVLKMFDKDGYELLTGYIADLKFNDESNREGHAAKVYFNTLFGKGFSRADDNNINAALNYGYAMILSACNREITANGYITQLGIHHSNVFNMFNLGSDMMEPFRAFVDIKVYDLWQNGELESFDRTQKLEIVDVLNRNVRFDEKTYSLNYAMKLYCKDVFDSLNEKDISRFSFCTFRDE